MSEARPFFDPIKGDTIYWKPLGHKGANVVTQGLGDQQILEVNALGTCGDPTRPGYSSYRIDTLFPILRRYDIDEKERAFNPEVSRWTPLRAPVEGIHTARAAVNLIAVTNQTDSPAGTMDAGMATYGSLKRGQEVMVSIQLDEETSEKSVRGRKLAKDVLQMISKQYPMFTIEDDIELLAHAAGRSLKNKILQAASGVYPRVEYVLPPKRDDLLRSIYLTGSSGNRRPRWIKRVEDIITAHDFPVEDSYRSNYDETAQADEFLSKRDVAVQLTAITSETEALAALAEVGPRMLLAELQGQAFGLYVEPHKGSAPDSATNRTRTLLLEHLKRLRQDFPDAPFFVAKSLEELALYGMGKHLEYRSRQDAEAN